MYIIHCISVRAAYRWSGKSRMKRFNAFDFQRELASKRNPLKVSHLTVNLTPCLESCEDRPLYETQRSSDCDNWRRKTPRIARIIIRIKIRISSNSFDRVHLLFIDFVSRWLHQQQVKSFSCKTDEFVLVHTELSVDKRICYSFSKLLTKK